MTSKDVKIANGRNKDFTSAPPAYTVYKGNSGSLTEPITNLVDKLYFILWVPQDDFARDDDMCLHEMCT